MAINTRRIGILGGLVLLAASGASQASLISNPTLAHGDSYFLGFIGDGIPSSLAHELGYINNLNDLAAGAGPTTGPDGQDYDRSDSTHAGPFNEAVISGALKEDGVSENNNTSQQSGVYEYILGKYDGPNYGSLVWYNIDGFTGDITLPTTAGGYGLSHMSFFNNPSTQVPLPATLLLFGLGLVGLGLLARRGR